MSKISIITINLNNKQGLARTIESVVNQSCNDYEYIIIDGGSTDGSIDIIDRFKKRITHWVSESDNGIYNAMNKGITLANGEYCLFLNSGDFFYNDFVLQNIIGKLNNYDIIYGNIIILPNNINLGNSDELKKYSKPYPGRKKSLKIYYRFGPVIPHQAEFIKRSVFNRIGYYDEQYKIASDVEFNIRAIDYSSLKFKYIGDIISYFILDGIGSDFDEDSQAHKETELILKRFSQSKTILFFKALYLLDKKMAKLTNYIKKRCNIFFTN